MNIKYKKNQSKKRNKIRFVRTEIASVVNAKK